MNPSPSPMQIGVVEASPDCSPGAVTVSPLRRVVLMLAHGVWVFVVLLDAAVFIPGAALYYHIAHTACPSRTVPSSVCAVGQLSPTELQAFSRLGLSLDLYAALLLALLLIVSAVFFVTGALIARRTWDESMGLLASLILITLGANGSVGAFQSVDSQFLPSLSPQLVNTVGALGGVLFFVQWPVLGAFLLTFPTGRFTPPWAWVLVGLWITNFFAFWLAPSLVITMLSVAVTYGSVVVAQVYRYRRVYGTVERQQTKWLVYALAVGVGLDIAYAAALAAIHSPPSSALQVVVQTAAGAVHGAVIFLLIGLAVAIALLRYRLYDIDLIINRTLVYGALTALVIGGYVLIVGDLGALFQAHGSVVLSLLATGLVAILFQPARERLQQGVNRLLYGNRDEPYVVIARLGRQMEAALAPEAILPTVATTIRDALKLPYAAIVLDGDDERAVAVGEPRGELLRTPLIHAGAPVGELLLSPRAPGDSWTAAERKLLEDLAHSAGGAVQAVRLTRELQRSREHLVLAREEERRRLRRDLHDELAPSLAALALTASTAAELIPAEADRARQLVTELESALRLNVGEVRRLAHDLRPPTLDELGLVAAIRERAQQISAGGQSRALQVEVEAPDQLPPLSAAAEVAAYRIIQEALMNVLSHAHARHCLVRLAVLAEDARLVLELQVEDDGRGLPDLGGGRGYGVGLHSMQERAEELGGSCSIERAAAGGTCVRVRLPIGAVREDVGDGWLAGAHR